MNPKPGYKEDTSLLLRCKNGENSAFKELYQQYARAMLNISIRIVNDKSEAEDILQECFLKAFQQVKRFDKEAAFGTWLKRVVINRSIDIIRKKKDMFTSLDEAGYLENEE